MTSECCTNSDAGNLSHVRPQGRQQKSDPNVTALLCHSPGISSHTDPQPYSNRLCNSAQQDALTRPVPKRQFQHAAQQPGLSIHQVDVHHVNCNPSSAQSQPEGALLKAGTSTAHAPNALTAPATTTASYDIRHKALASVSIPPSRCGTAVQQQVDRHSTMTDDHKFGCNSRQEPVRAPDSSTTTHSARLCAAVTGRPPACMFASVHRNVTPDAQASVCSSSSAARSFLCACATPGSVAALGVLAHHKMLPVLLQHDVDSTPSQTSATGSATGTLTATLAYMFVLAGRAGLLERRLSDTSIRTLLWITESFFSQYRSSCKVVAFDYLFYSSGLDLQDSFVLETLEVELPFMIYLQHHILVETDFRLLVNQEQLSHACSVLEAVGTLCSGCGAHPCNSCSAGTDIAACSIAEIQQKVDSQVQVYKRLAKMSWEDRMYSDLHPPMLLQCQLPADAAAGSSPAFAPVGVVLSAKEVAQVTGLYLWEYSSQFPADEYAAVEDVDAEKVAEEEAAEEEAAEEEVAEEEVAEEEDAADEKQAVASMLKDTASDSSQQLTVTAAPEEHPLDCPQHAPRCALQDVTNKLPTDSRHSDHQQVLLGVAGLHRLEEKPRPCAQQQKSQGDMPAAADPVDAAVCPGKDSMQQVLQQGSTKQAACTKRRRCAGPQKPSKRSAAAKAGKPSVAESQENVPLPAGQQPAGLNRVLASGAQMLKRTAQSAAQVVQYLGIR